MYVIEAWSALAGTWLAIDYTASQYVAERVAATAERQWHYVTRIHHV